MTCLRCTPLGARPESAEGVLALKNRESLRIDQQIPAPPREHQLRLAWIALERLAQLPDVPFDAPRARARIGDAHQLADLPGADHLPGALGEDHEEVVLGGTQRHRPIAHDDLACAAIDDQALADPENRVPLGERAVRAPQHGFHARDQLARAERLDQVIVAAELQAGHLVVYGLLRGEEDDGHGGDLADASARLQAVHARHDYVEDDQVRAMLEKLAQAFFAARRGDRLEAGVEQSQLDHAHVRRIVVDDEYSLRHSQAL